MCKRAYILFPSLLFHSSGDLSHYYTFRLSIGAQRFFFFFFLTICTMSQKASQDFLPCLRTFKLYLSKNWTYDSISQNQNKQNHVPIKQNPIKIKHNEWKNILTYCGGFVIDKSTRSCCTCLNITENCIWVIIVQSKAEGSD